MSVIELNGSDQSDVLRCKIVVLGNVHVGKSSLVLQYTRRQFYSNLGPTIGASFVTQTVSLDNKTIRLEIWDTAGHERFHRIVRFYCRGAHAAVVVYDITNQNSYKGAKQWVKELQEELGPDTVIALAGNKLDLESMRVIEYEEAKAYAEKKGLLFMEISGKTAMNVNDVFLAVAEKLINMEQPEHTSCQGISIIKCNTATDTTRNCCK